MTVFRLLLTGLLLAGAPLIASSLPPPPAFDLPPVASHPGGLALPSLNASPAPEAPALSALSEITLPGETLAITGHNLANASLRIWAEGMVTEVTPLSALSDRMTALVPADLPHSTMLVWPVRGDLVGTPLRVNAAAAWWAWPERVIASAPAQRLKLMGKNLTLENATPRLYLQSSSFSGFLDITETGPYQLEALIPSLPPGPFRIWAHNGTGGVHGWSEPLLLEAVDERPHHDRFRVDVTTHGAIPDDGKDDHAALSAAIAEVARRGGGTVYLPPGTYTLSRPLEISSDHIRLLGAGLGTYTPGAETAEGVHTRLAYAGPEQIPDALLVLRGRHLAVENMMIVSGHDGQGRSALVVRRPDVLLRQLRVVFLDRRDWGYPQAGPPSAPGLPRRSPPYARGMVDTGAITIDTEGRANILVIDCEVHAAGPGIQIGRFSGWDTSVSQPPSQSVWIERTTFRGYYAGEPDGRTNSGSSGRATGLVIYSGQRIAMRNSDLGSAARQNARVMGRTVLAFNSSIRDLYFAQNRSVNIGPHPSALGMDVNQGEQYLIHYRYPHGGLFNLTAATADSATISLTGIEPFTPENNPTTPQQARRGRNWDRSRPHFHVDTRGGQVLDEVSDGQGNWLLFVASGKGVGQFREIDTVHPAPGGHRFTLTAPWQVAPDTTSRVVLMPAYRRVVIYDNFVDTGEHVLTHKTHGVCLWFDNFENIVDGNTFRNLTSGVVVNSRYRAATGWNTVRNNLIENIAGHTGDTSEKPAGLVDHFRLTLRWPNPEDRVWYQVGNVTRGNTVRDATVGAYLHTRYTGYVGSRKPETVEHPEGGIVLSIVENNRFENVAEGVVLSSPVNTSVIRANTIGLSTPGGELVRNQDSAADVIHTVIEGNRSP
jgi:hypothetical protein